MDHPFSKKLETIPKSRIREFFDIVSNQKDIISLGVGEPDFATPWTIREEAIFAIESGETAYTSNQGLPALRKAISKHLKSHKSVSYEPDSEILITNGVSEGADIVLRALLNPGDEVIIPQPMYVCYEPLTQLAGGTVVPINTEHNDFILDPVDLEKAITKKTKALVLCYPNNPTGRNIPPKNLEAIAKLVQKHDLWVLSDEIYSDILFSGTFQSIAALPNMKNKTILLDGFSKAYAMTGWRVGYICGPESIISRACKIHQYSALCASRIAQFAALEALKNAKPDMTHMITSYKQRMSFFIDEIRAIGLDVHEPEGSLYCFPSIRKTGLTSHEFAKSLIEKAKVAVVPGDAFGQGGEGHIRCCIATGVSDLKLALKRIKKFCEEL